MTIRSKCVPSLLLAVALAAHAAAAPQVASPGRSLATMQPPQKVVLPVAPPTVIPISTLPFVASAPGYYQVTQNLNGIAGDHGISILVSGVVVDLNGFAVTGVPGSLTGVRVGFRSLVFNGQVALWDEAGVSTGSQSAVANLNVAANGVGLALGFGSVAERCLVTDSVQEGITGPALTVVDCLLFRNEGDAIRGTGAYLDVRRCRVMESVGFGIRAVTLAPDERNDALVEDCIVQDSGIGGIELLDHAQVRGCTVSGSANRGIGVQGSSTVERCIADHNDIGISVGAGSRVESCRASDNGVGIFTTTRCSVSDCEVVDNTSKGIDVGQSSSVMRCVVSGVEDGIVFRGPGGRVEHCTVQGSMQHGITVVSGTLVSSNDVLANPGTGILAGGTANRIDGNHLVQNGLGLHVEGDRNLIVRNSLDTNVVQTQIAANNVVGPILKTKGFVQNENPWANFDLSFPPQVP